MNGETPEFRDGCVTLENVDASTFAAFWSFVTNGDYDPAVDNRSIEVIDQYKGRREDTEDSECDQIGRVGLRRTLTDRLASPETEFMDDEISVRLSLDLRFRTSDIPLEPFAAVMAEKFDFGQNRQERKQDKKVRKPCHHASPV
jgi:hypothetical protein